MSDGRLTKYLQSFFEVGFWVLFFGGAKVAFIVFEGVFVLLGLDTERRATP